MISTVSCHTLTGQKPKIYLITSGLCRGRQDIFTDRALDDIYKESTGIPRRINRICEKSPTYASQQGKRLIDEHLVRYIIEHEMLGGDV